MRSKEEANDYRYFPEPDLLPLTITEDYVDHVRKQMPPLPRELMRKYTETLGLSSYDAGVLTDSKEIALYFEEVIRHTGNYKAAANWVMGEVKSYLNERGVHIRDFPLQPEQVGKLVAMIDSGKISHSAASQKLFPAWLEQPQQEAESLAESLDLIQQRDEDALGDFIRQVIEKNPAEVERYRQGEKKLIGFLMGQLMKVSRGKADPKKSNQLLRSHLENGSHENA